MAMGRRAMSTVADDRQAMGGAAPAAGEARERGRGPVLVVADAPGGVPTAPTLELLTLARSLAREPAPGGGSAGPFAVLLGGAPEDALRRLGAYGVARVFEPDLAGHDPRVAAVAAEALAAVVRQADPEAVLFVSTFATKEAAAHLAVLLGSGVVVDGARIERADDGALAVEKTVFAGTWVTRCRVPVGTPLVTVKPHSVEAAPAAEALAPEVVRVPVAFSPAASALRVVERTDRRDAGGRPALAEARVVVAGGRGTEGDFTLVEELADLLGGAVGATRVATDEGWIDHSAQIGQTGVTVSPRLYIGAGISGAVHHRGGMQAAETVVAINTDPDAPIFEFADFGVVGDLTEVIPQAIAEIRRLRGG